MRTARRSILLLSVAVLIVATCRLRSASGPDKEDAEQAPLLMPGGVGSPDGKTGFVVNADGMVEALELKSGKVLWATSVPCKPLIATNNRLIVQASDKGKVNSIRIRVLDIAANGNQILESDPVTFPDWVSTGLTYGRSFSSAGRIQKGSLLLTWDARAFYAGGAAPPPEILKQSRKEAHGVAKINLEKGNVEMLADVPTESRLPAALEKVKSLPYWTGSASDTRPLIVNGKVAALQMENAGNGIQKLTLKTWDLSTAKANASVELLEGKSLWVQIAPGSRFVCVHQALVKNQLPDGDYAWWVFSLETGERIAKVPFEEGTQTVVVIGPRLFYSINQPRKGPPVRNFDTPRQLKAVDLKTGKVVWEHSIEGQKRLPPLP